MNLWLVAATLTQVVNTLQSLNELQGLASRNVIIRNLQEMVKSLPRDVQETFSPDSQTAIGVPHIAASPPHQVLISTMKRPATTPLLSLPLPKLERLSNTENLPTTSKNQMVQPQLVASSNEYDNVNQVSGVECIMSGKSFNNSKKRSNLTQHEINQRNRNIIYKMKLNNTIDKIEREKYFQQLAANYRSPHNFAKYLFREMVCDNKKGLRITEQCHICSRPYKTRHRLHAKHLIVDHNVNLSLRRYEEQMVMGSSAEADSTEESSCQNEKVTISNIKQDTANLSATYSRADTTIQSNVTNEKTVMANSTRENQSTASKISHAILSFITKTNQPFNIVESDGFRELMRASAPSYYKIPNQRTITRMFEDKYESLSNTVKDELKNASGICFTTDTWIEKNNPKIIVGLTAHYIIDENYKNVTIGVDMFTNRHTPKDIEEKLKSIISKWNIQNQDILAIVTNNGTNVKTILQMNSSGIIQERCVAAISTIADNITKAIDNFFGSEKVLPCFAYILNVIPSRIIERIAEHEMICQLINKVKDIVIFFQRSSDAYKKLRLLTEERLILGDKVQWNSCYAMLQQFVSIVDKVSDVLQKSREPPMLTNSELSIIKDFIDLFEPFSLANDIISKEKYFPGSKIIPLVNELKNQLQVLKPKTDPGLSLKECLLKEFDNRFEHIEKSSLLGMATLLDPRFKKLHFRSKSNTWSNIRWVAKRLNSLVNNNTNTGTNSFWDYIDTSKLKKAPSKDIDDIPEELRRYVDSNVIDKGINPIEFWEKQQQSPLSKIAIRYLTLIATTVPLERTKNRIHYRYFHFKQLLFLNSLTVENNSF